MPFIPQMCEKDITVKSPPQKNMLFIGSYKVHTPAFKQLIFFLHIWSSHLFPYVETHVLEFNLSCKIKVCNFESKSLVFFLYNFDISNVIFII